MPKFVDLVQILEIWYTDVRVVCAVRIVRVFHPVDKAVLACIIPLPCRAVLLIVSVDCGGGVKMRQALHLFLQQAKRCQVQKSEKELEPSFCTDVPQPNRICFVDY